MKNLFKSMLFVIATCAASAALAAPPPWAGQPTCPGAPEEPDAPGKTKSDILHCGCTSDGDAMEYVAISVSRRSRGHDAHVTGSIDSCFDGVDTYTDFVRTGSDCQVGGAPLGDPIDACQGQAEFQSCGAAVID